MFVPHKPEFCFDVERHTGRCVCGCSPRVTSHSGIDTGYCETCAKKRKKFVTEVVGDIHIEDKQDNLYSMLNIIEGVRKSYFEERIYYMVDKFFGAQRPSKDLQEPYENDDFLARVYQEKDRMMEQFLPNLPLFLQLGDTNPEIYNYYASKLNVMICEDLNKLEEINARLRGYAYIKSNKTGIIYKVAK